MACISHAGCALNMWSITEMCPPAKISVSGIFRSHSQIESVVTYSMGFAHHAHANMCGMHFRCGSAVWNCLCTPFEREIILFGRNGRIHPRVESSTDSYCLYFLQCQQLLFHVFDTIPNRGNCSHTIQRLVFMIVHYVLALFAFAALACFWMSAHRRNPCVCATVGNFARRFCSAPSSKGT